MKILFVYPQYPETFWSFKYALKFVSKKASFPPLGALTVAAMLPERWEKKLVDLNINALTDADIQWADYVFVSAMIVQKDSAREVIRRCNTLGTRVVCGGPLFTTASDEFTGVDHFILNEAEITLPLFLKDLNRGKPQKVYSTDIHPEIAVTPKPLWSLIDMRQYSSMSLQYSRGCPFNCEFCNITLLDGRIPRTKSREQLLAELDSLYDAGWRGELFIVDDNFIGNKTRLKKEILPAMIEWMKQKHHPFNLSAEASINLADDEELMRLMVEAGFSNVFIGIETPNEASLAECNKTQNTSRDMVASVRKIQNFGMEVIGGFIVGFDNDPPSIFKNQIDFIQKSAVVTAMVGILNAPRGTRLYQRLQRENRLLKESSGDNMDYSLSYIPKMDPQALIKGYRDILNTIYAPEYYYARVKTLLEEYRPKTSLNKSDIKWCYVKGLFNCLWFIGVRDRGRKYYWRLLASTVFTRPKSFPLMMRLSVYGYHFRKVIRRYTEAPVETGI